MATQPNDRRKFKAAMKKPAPPRAFAKRNQPHGPHRTLDGGWDYAAWLAAHEQHGWWK